MTKDQLKRKLRALGEKSTNRAIADIFGIYPQAVQVWPGGKKLPPLRLLELEKLRPDLLGRK